jgi:UDP-N-acetylglucosamine 2-epimerase (non-hydrolysing)
MKKIIVLVGTRPEAIKLAPVVHELKKTVSFRVILCSTGQHREMLDQAFEDFELTPDINLNLMTQGQTLAGLSARLFTGLDELFEYEKPDCIVVQGDTTTVMIASFCAFYRGVKVAHVEAGLRTHQKRSPFPEEINRRVTGLLADIHFAPTRGASANLLNEGVDESSVIVTGNTVIDSLLWMARRVKEIPPTLPANIEELLKSSSRIVLITGHRRESFGMPFENICNAIRELAHKYTDVAFVYPVHLNPNVQSPVQRILNDVKGVILTEPMSYKPFVRLMASSEFILTDSGGIQEEAPSLGKKVLVMRDSTERPEGVQAGCCLLVGSEKNRIVEEVSRLLEQKNKAVSIDDNTQNPYGDGHAAYRIARELIARI